MKESGLRAANESLGANTGRFPLILTMDNWARWW